MAERPIIFSGESVRKILAGIKTQTRRIVKPQPISSGGGMFDFGKGLLSTSDALRRRRFHPDDTLWVKETWQRGGEFAVTESAVGRRLGKDEVLYAADQVPPYGICGRLWKSPLFMPRAVARLFLTVESVGIERLHDITASDAIEEGIDGAGGNDEFRNRPSVENFAIMWDEINGKKWPWASNPSVWKIAFKVRT